MKVKLSSLGAVAIVMALALTGLLGGVRSTRAIIPQPLQPFGPEAKGGMSTTQLDTTALGNMNVLNYTYTEIIKGERIALPWIFSGTGFRLAVDADITNDTIIGSVISELDALCDGGVDTMAKLGSVSPFWPYDWREKTTAVAGTDQEFLLTIMPPLPFLLRHETIVDNIYINGVLANPTYNVLNTVYTDVTWAPGAAGGAGRTYIATTKLGGNAVYSNQKGRTCLDSPQTSNSITGLNGITVYKNPLDLGNGADAIDDATGLYPRWTIFQNGDSHGYGTRGDHRKPFLSPPSLPSDVNYVERILDLDCYWIDIDGCFTNAGNTITCDSLAGGGNNDTIIQPEESWNDFDLGALGGIGAVDNDGDCLQNATAAQPGRPTDTVDTLTGTLCDALIYSGQPNVITDDIAKDQDCDGLPDGVEYAFGSSPTAADTDIDGATDFVEMFQFTNPNDTDTDNDGLLDKPEDDYVAAVAGAAEAGEAVNADDNCPGISNANQANNDGQHRPPGQEITGSTFARNPNQDKWGDACDQDDDNDSVVDVAEAIDGCADLIDNDFDGVVNDGCPGGPAAAGGPEHGPTNPLDNDSDGDHCVDGVEGWLGAYPTSSAVPKCPGAMDLDQIKFFRACRWNEPTNGYDSGIWDLEQDGVEDNVEFDSDDDGLDCITGASITDDDNDNGTGTGSAAPDQITDNAEIMGYNLQAANKDTDGDGCEDWIEIVDLTGNNKADMNDVLAVVKKWFNLLGGEDSAQTGYTPPVGACTDTLDNDGDTVADDCASSGAKVRVTTHAANDLLDIDRNGTIGQSDAMQAAKNSNLVKSHSTCAAEAP